MKKIFGLVLTSVWLSATIGSEPAHAYLDPGTGSMILQSLAAGALAVGVFFRQIKMALCGLFGKCAKKTEDDASEE